MLAETMKSTKWNTSDGNTVEISKGYPLSKLICVMATSLTSDEIKHCITEMQKIIIKRGSAE